MRLPRLCCFAAFVCPAVFSGAASFDARVELLFRPPLAEMMALSPDGARVAYTLQTGGNLRIALMDLEHPEARRTVDVEPPRDAATADQPPLQLRFLRWATAGRLVFAPIERVVPLPPVPAANGRLMPNPDGPTIFSPIMAMDADGRQRGTLVDARDFMDTPDDARRTLADLLRTPKQLVASRNEPVRWRMPHLDILGFFPGDREQLVIQTKGGFGMPAQHLVDIRTGSVREFGGDWPSPPGEPQVFDWFRLRVVGERRQAVRPTTVWRDGELERVQRELEVKFPRRAVEILDWSETRARVLFRVTGGSDPGRVFVYRRTEDLVLEILRRAPWLKASSLNDTRFFEFDAPDGAHLSGYLTWPKNRRVQPPPLLVVFPSEYPGGAQPAFDPEAQVFADLGFLVARLNHRHAAAVTSGNSTVVRLADDRVVVDDVRAAVAWIAARMPDRPFDPKRVATLGRGFGGYLAVRALQLQPALFRGGVALGVPVDLRMWLQPPQALAPASAPEAGREDPAALIAPGAANGRNSSALDAAPALANPAFFLVEPRGGAAVPLSAEELRARVASPRGAPRHLGSDPALGAELPASRATVYRQIEEFLNLSLRDYAVTIGPAEEVK